MSQLLSAMRNHATRHPLRIAMQDGRATITYGELLPLVERLATHFREVAPSGVALLSENSCAWVLADLALHLAKVPCIPLPLFFSQAQIDHALAISGVRIMLTDAAFPKERMPDVTVISTNAALGGLQLLALPSRGGPGPKFHSSSTKITFTSGTTGEPKGVCLDDGHLESVAMALLEASEGNCDDRHLCLLPLSTLLENVAGIYVPILAGAQICVPPLAEVGLTGSSGLNPLRMAKALVDWGATTAITVPQTLHALLAAAARGATISPTLRYVAVGGAPVPMSLLKLAHKARVPVYEGYGLSECGSVVALNRPKSRRLGSVGKPLRHVQIEFGNDGEILVGGARWHGYLGGTSDAGNQPTPTGDLGYLDTDGYLHVTGRIKNNFITSFGRNVSPEWVEGELVMHAPIVQAAVFGESKPFNVAVIFVPPGKTTVDIESAVLSTNASLPDYARVEAWVPATEAFSLSNGLLTHNGRVRRDRILAAYMDQISAAYERLTPLTESNI